MAEGFSFKPDEETTDNTAETAGAKRADTFDRFKLFLGDLFKSKEKKEDEDDDTETAGRKGRFARAWKRLFGGAVVQRENIETGHQEVTPQSGLFFELAPSETARTSRVDGASKETPRDTFHDREDPTSEATAESLPSEGVSESVPTDVRAQTTSAEQDARQHTAEQAGNATTQERTQEVRERYYAVGPTALERARMRKLENDQRRVERDIKKAKESFEKRDVKRSTPEQRPIAAETREPAQQVRSVEALRPVRPEIVRAAKQTVERSPERQAIGLREVPKEAFKAEKIYNVPESVQKVVERIEKDDAKEIAYELSHEHKDLDKQSAAALALLQQQADTRAKAAQLAMQQAAKTTPSQKNKQQKNAQNAGQQQMYQQAALGGFIAAVVIFAIVLVLLLLK